MSPDSWIERVKQADADAEEVWEGIEYVSQNFAADVWKQALIAIAAELRAQRIARRPGAGQ